MMFILSLPPTTDRNDSQNVLSDVQSKQPQKLILLTFCYFLKHMEMSSITYKLADKKRTAKV